MCQHCFNQRELFNGDAHGPPWVAADSLTFSLDTNVTYIQSAASVFDRHNRRTRTPTRCFFPTHVLKKGTFYCFKEICSSDLFLFVCLIFSYLLFLLLNVESIVLMVVQYFAKVNDDVILFNGINASTLTVPSFKKICL